MIGPVSCSIRRGEHRALIGHNGSGKTTLLKLLRGEYLPDRGGERVYCFDGTEQRSVVGLRHRIGMVSADQQDFYSFHASRTLGRSVVLSGFFDTPLVYEDVTEEQEAAAETVIQELDIVDLAQSEVGALSTGQVRKLLIARALVTRPVVLLLDECLDGLDVSSRSEILTLLDTVAQEVTLVCAAHRIGDLPGCVESVMAFDQGQLVADMSRTEAAERLAHIAPEMGACEMPVRAVTTDYVFLLKMRDVSVVVDGNRILHHVDWDVLPGENWVVIGENGAGKSTLLRLIMSEIAPYADEKGPGSVARLGGLTMDEARPRIGVVSPAFQASYARELGWDVSVLETILSGYRGSVGMLDEPTSEELLGAQQWLARIGMSALAAHPLRRLSYGQQRRVFLARAMVFGPELLLLDEPMSGLDSATRSAMASLLQHVAEAGTSLIMVTHHDEDWIPAINRVARIVHGHLDFAGSRDEFIQR